MKLAPSLFIGHGSPMNVIENNQFNKNIRELGIKLSHLNLKGIICLSAHYQTDGIFFDESDFPKTIYDFYGFPKELYELSYQAHGNKQLALKLSAEFNGKTSKDWGLDHGAWNVLWHLFPNAELPIVMMSLDYKLNLEDHFTLGKQLKKYREDGYLILASGNIVHSFKGIDFTNSNPPHIDALKFNQYVEKKILEKNYQDLIFFEKNIFESAKFSINSAEHYIPLLYTLGSLAENEEVELFNNEIVYSTLSMFSLQSKIL